MTSSENNSTLQKGAAFLPVVLLSLTMIAVPALLIDECAVDDLADRVRTRLAEFQKELGFPGATVGFVLRNGREGAVAVGFSDKEDKKPLTIQDRLLSGSIGKTYVSAVALQLVAEEKLGLDDAISRWFAEAEWFPRLPNAPDITVRMLMNHTSGIPEHVLLPEFGRAVGENPDRVWKPVELLSFSLDKKPLFPAGEGWSYADTNYIVLGMIIEEITGRPYYEVLKQRLLQPLGLKNTVPSDSRTIPGVVPGYASERTPFLIPGKTIREGRFVVNPQAEWTGGGLASTTLDLARWSQAVYQGKAFPDRLMKPLLDGVPAFTGKGDRYGLGVQIWESKQGTCMGHGGWFPGYLSLIAYYDELNLALAIQLNTDQVPEAMRNLRSFLDECAGILESRK